MAKKKVLLLTIGSRDHGSSRVSALNHFAKFTNEFDITWCPKTPEQKRGSFFEKVLFAIKKRLFIIRQYLVIIFKRFDLVYVQVMFVPEFCLKIFKRRGTVFCYNVDDAIYLDEPDKFEVMMRYANKITVSSPVMQQFISRYNIPLEFIFSPVDTDLLQPVTIPHPLLTIGWIGSPSTAPYLQSLAKAFKALGDKVQFQLLVMGGQVNMEGVNVIHLPWSEAAEIDALKKIDIGVMPLFDNEIARMKGGYKLFMYMSSGKPVVASPYGINADIVKPGINGFLAENDEQWYQALLKLSTDAGLRAEMGKQGRRDAENLYSYNVCSKQLLAFLNK